MNEQMLVKNVICLITKYLNERNDLVELIRKDSDSVKYIFSEIDKYKKCDFEEKDIALIKEISYYWL